MNRLPILCACVLMACPAAPAAPVDGPAAERRDGPGAGAAGAASAERPPAIDPEKAPGAQPARGGGQPGFVISFTPRGEHTFSSDLRDSRGEAGVTRAGVGIDLSAPLAESLRFSLGVDVEYSHYRFGGVGDLLPGAAAGKDPIGDALQLRFTLGATVFLSREWAVLAGAIVELAGEPGVDVSKAATFGGFAGARWQVSDRLSATFGAIAKTRLEDDAIVVPLLGVRWAIDDKLTLASDGLGLRLTAKVAERWSASLFGRWELRDYRLEDDAPIPEGVVRDTRVPVGVGLTWAAAERFSVTLSGGAVVYQRFQFDDRDGNGVANDKTRAAPFIGLRGEIAF